MYFDEIANWYLLNLRSMDKNQNMHIILDINYWQNRDGNIFSLIISVFLYMCKTWESQSSFFLLLKLHSRFFWCWCQPLLVWGVVTQKDARSSVFVFMVLVSHFDALLFSWGKEKKKSQGIAAGGLWHFSCIWLQQRWCWAKCIALKAFHTS